MSQSKPSALSSKRIFNLNVPTKGEFGLKSYECLCSDRAGSRVERLLLPLKTGDSSAVNAWCPACSAKRVPQGSVAPQGTRSSPGLSGKGCPWG